MHKKVKLSQVRPNPFRNMDLYPIDPIKIETLKSSFKKTGYWGNIVARENGGIYEIAYGHHRLVTMQQTMKKSDEVELIIRDIDDADMLRMMADENMDEYHTSSVIEQETIRAVVLAYSEGKIELPRPKGVDRHNVKGWRLAPAFRVVNTKEFDFTDHKIKPYNAESIAKFLGWMSGDQVSPRIRNALLALEAAEELDAEEQISEITRGLTSEQAKEVVHAIKDIKTSHEKAGRNETTAKQKALNAGKSLAEKAKKGASVRELRDGREDYKPAKQKKHESIPAISEFLETIAGRIDGFFRGDQISEGFNELMKYKEYIDGDTQIRLIRILRNAANRCEEAASCLEQKSVGTKVHMLEN